MTQYFGFRLWYYGYGIRIINSKMRWACSTNGEKRNAYSILVGKPEGNRPLGRPRCR
jgi:hypothetical protein